MAHIYWELHEIPRPSGSYINHTDGRVFLMSDDGLGNKKRRVIGHATSETMMHPNDLYKYLYPSEWEEYYGKNGFLEHELHIGMYALSLGIGYMTELYPILHKVYGPLYGNAIMDYAMYSIMERSDTTQLLEDRMSYEVLFSKERYSDSWYSDFFRTHMAENLNHQFRLSWLGECARQGTTKVWLSIDGSNNDCQAHKSLLSEPGNAKSLKNVSIVSYIWAVDAQNGRPVTYFVNNGGMVDSKAFQKLAAVLKDSGIGIDGIILDRGFCTHDVFTMLEECGYPYIIMLKSDTYGHTQMMEQYAESIRWKVPYVLNENGIFGISDRKKVFGNHPEEAYIHLYFDGMNGASKTVTLLEKILVASKCMKAQAQEGKKPAVPSGLSPYFKVTQEGVGWKVEYDYSAWQKAMDGKGYCSIASSEDYDAAFVDHLYHLRDASEKQYMVMKSQLGFDVTRVHSTESIQNKFMVCFVASILRSEIQTACRKKGLDTNQMIREIDRIALILMTDGLYSAINNLSVRQKELLSEFGIQSGNFKQLADDVNHRLKSSVNSQVRRLPSDPVITKKKRGRPPKEKKELAPDQPKRKPGRPKGSKNKKTLELEASNMEKKEKRKPGRPKGSKNKPKAETEKRKPGRPRKSSNS